MGFFDFASNVAETRELHQKTHLRTRYYRTSYVNLKSIVLAYANVNNINVISEDDIHKEIFLQSNKFHMIVSIVQVTPLESAVDLKVQSYRLIGLFKPDKIILDLFKHLNQKTAVQNLYHFYELFLSHL